MVIILVNAAVQRTKERRNVINMGSSLPVRLGEIMHAIKINWLFSPLDGSLSDKARKHSQTLKLSTPQHCTVTLMSYIHDTTFSKICLRLVV